MPTALILTVAVLVPVTASESGAEPVLVPPVGAVTTARALSAGEAFNCVIDTALALRCWGSGGAGRLGNNGYGSIGVSPGQMGDNLPPVDLGTGRTAIEVSAEGAHTCVILDDHNLKCWGENGSGQLGYGDTDRRGQIPGQLGDNLPPIDLGTGRTAVFVDAESYRTCAILDNGDLKCWGDGEVGRLGQGNQDNIGDEPGEMGDNLPPIDLGTGRTAVSVTAGAFHTCALLDNGSVKCWGLGSEGELGFPVDFGIGDDPGEMGDNLPPVDLGTGRTALAISAAGLDTCALLDDHSIKCWGFGTGGMLGFPGEDHIGDDPGEMGDNLPAVDLGTGRTALAVTGGSFHFCALLDDHSIKCWGDNFYGQLGRGDTVDIGDDPGEMGDNLAPVDLGTGRTALAVDAGGIHTCALLDDLTVKCWGWGRAGQLGQGNHKSLGNEPGEMGDNLPPVDIPALATAPSTPSLVAEAHLDPAAVTLDWTPPERVGLVSGLTGYRVERSTDGRTWWPIAKVPATTLSHRDESVQTDTEYRYRVTAVNLLGPGSPSPDNRVTVPGAWIACHDTRPVGYWLVEVAGEVHPFGDATPLGDGVVPVNERILDIQRTATGCGYWVLRNDGAVEAFGDAAEVGDFDPSLAGFGESLVSFSPTPTGEGLWGFTNRGRVLTLGDARPRFAGSISDLTGIALDGPVIDSVPTPSGNGYYMLGSDGGVFAFGDAAFAGSLPGMGVTPDQPVVGLVPDPDGSGYWLVAADGGVFAFDAPFVGSLPGIGITRLNAPIIGMTPYADGYLQVASDGGVFNFSSRPFSGSLGDDPPDTPVVALTPVWSH